MRAKPTSALLSLRFRPCLEWLEDRLAPAVLPAMIGPDPLDNAKTALIVTGTVANDTIWIRPNGAMLNVVLNKIGDLLADLVVKHLDPKQAL